MSTPRLFPGSGQPPFYVAESPWPPFRAVLMTLLVLVLALGAGFSAIVLLGLSIGSEDDLAGGSVPDWVALTGQLVMQAVVVGLAVWIAGWLGGQRRQVLALHTVHGLPGTVAKAFVLLTVISGIYTVFAVTFARESVLQDLAPLWPLVKGDAWWLMVLVAVVGAPLSEELLFRGYLQSALAKSPLGFWGAALITNTGWAALHFEYSALGLIDVFIAGLIFTWLLWRTGSLWVPIICHGLYNGLIFAALAILPLPDNLPVPA